MKTKTAPKPAPAAKITDTEMLDWVLSHMAPPAFLTIRTVESWTAQPASALVEWHAKGLDSQGDPGTEGLKVTGKTLRGAIQKAIALTGALAAHRARVAAIAAQED
jgi:hypothetical protein